jgi:hypothetical protein
MSFPIITLDDGVRYRVLGVYLLKEGSRIWYGNDLLYDVVNFYNPLGEYVHPRSSTVDGVESAQDYTTVVASSGFSYQLIRRNRPHPEPQAEIRRLRIRVDGRSDDPVPLITTEAQQEVKRLTELSRSPPEFEWKWRTRVEFLEKQMAMAFKELHTHDNEDDVCRVNLPLTREESLPVTTEVAPIDPIEIANQRLTTIRDQARAAGHPFYHITEQYASIRFDLDWSTSIVYFVFDSEKAFYYMWAVRGRLMKPTRGGKVCHVNVHMRSPISLAFNNEMSKLFRENFGVIVDHVM